MVQTFSKILYLEIRKFRRTANPSITHEDITMTRLHTGLIQDRQGLDSESKYEGRFK